jgi:metal-responsive CopG/Arc/MetJ family transcriptional regulator
MSSIMVRPTLNPKPNQIQLRCSDEYLQALDEWRAKQRPIPSRSEAIRQLTMIGLSELPSTVKPKEKKK